MLFASIPNIILAATGSLAAISCQTWRLARAAILNSKQLRREVRLMNPYKFDIYFTVKSTAPEYYIVAPPNGDLHAEKSIDMYALCGRGNDSLLTTPVS